MGSSREGGIHDSAVAEIAARQEPSLAQFEQELIRKGVFVESSG